MADSIVLERPLFHPDNKSAGAKRLRRRRLYILPTRQGVSFSVLLLVMLLGAANYDNSMAYILTFLLVSVFMICMLHTYRNLRGLIISMPGSKPVFAGTTALFPLLIDNRSGQKRISLNVVPYPKRKLRNRNNYLSDVKPVSVNVAAGDLQQVCIALPAQDRGYLHLGRVKIFSTYPLGLFHTWSYLDSQQVCLIYPKPAGNNQLPPFSEYESHEQIGTRTGTDDFIGFRGYRPGDAIRNIDWKILAREKGLLVRRFSGSGTNKLLLLWEQTAFVQNTEQRLSQLCLWILKADKENLYYGLEIPGCVIELDYGEHHKSQCLKALALYAINK